MGAEGTRETLGGGDGRGRSGRGTEGGALGEGAGATKRTHLGNGVLEEGDGGVKDKGDVCWALEGETSGAGGGGAGEGTGWGRRRKPREGGGGYGGKGGNTGAEWKECVCVCVGGGGGGVCTPTTPTTELSYDVVH